jgi:hypothetical protein
VKSDKPTPVTIHCVEENEQLALSTVEVTTLETPDAYGCPHFDFLDDPIKVTDHIILLLSLPSLALSPDFLSLSPPFLYF